MSVTRRTAIRGLLAAAVGAATGTAAFGSLYQRHRIVLTRVKVRVASLPSSLAGLRIGMLTDLHHSAFLPREDLALAVSMLVSDQPDLIVSAETTSRGRTGDSSARAPRNWRR